MPHDLDLLSRLVVGDLSPNSFNLAAPAIHRDFLRQRFGTYIRHFKIQYAETASSEFTYHHHDEFVFLELDALPRLPVGTAGVPPRTLGLLLADALPRFGLSVPEMQDAHCQQTGGQLFLEVTAASSLFNLSAEKARYFYYHTRLLDEGARLRRALPQRALQCSEAPACALYVQHHQRELQSLLAHLTSHLDASSPGHHYGKAQDYSLAGVHRLLYVEVEKLLAFVERTFTEHLDLTLPLSYGRRVQALTDVQVALSTVLLALRPAEELPEQLLAPVRECLGRLLITLHDTGLCYQDLLYSRALLHELHIRLKRGWPFTARNLACLLLRFNFNAPGFFGLLTTTLQAEADAAGPHPADRLPVILLHLKQYRQLQPATTVSYFPILPPLHLQMISWLKTERAYLTRQLRSHSLAVAPPLGDAARILSPLSVAQMAHLLRTLYDAGVFGNANQRDLFRLLATNFRTARQERISEKSLADKYYNAEDSTRQSTEKLVVKMLDNLRQTLG